MSVSLIITAAGAGKRFLKGHRLRGRTNKLFSPLGGKPLLAHTLESFKGIPEIREILLTIPRGTEKRVRTEILKKNPDFKVRLIPGGATRAESVWNALRRTSSKYQWVLVHDGARPFPSRDAIRTLLRKRIKEDGIILARPVVPTLKRVSPKDGRILGTVDRTHLFEAETPQLVRRAVILKAYKKNPNAFRATDESSLVESMGGRMKVFPHSGWNVKVTTPEDLYQAETHYQQASSSQTPCPVTAGFGRDTHRLVTGRKFFLGGVRIPFEKGPLGHSDGDALLHAVSDALLGAIGAGDIGEWFSDRNPEFKGIASHKILEAVLKEVKRKGWQAEHLDTVTLLEKPKLSPYKMKIRKNLAHWLNLPESRVSIKAKTMEGLGPEGEGLAVTCEAFVLLRRAS